MEGKRIFHLDSLNSNKNNKFIVSINNYKLHNGFHRLIFGVNKWIDFIYDGNDVEIKTDYDNLFGSLKIIGLENIKLYYEFLKLNKSYKTRTELLQLILVRYTKDDDYYLTTQNKLTKIQDEYLEFVYHASQNVPNSFIAKYIKSAQLPVIDRTLSIEEQLDYLKKHSLDNVAFNDDDLIYSDLFPLKV